MKRSASARVVASAMVGPEGDEGGVVAGNVGDDEGDDAGGVGEGGEAAALDARDLLAHGVHGADRRAGGEQGAVDGDFVGQRQVAGGRRQQGGAAAADQRHDEIVFREAAHGGHQPAGGEQAAVIRHRMGGFEHFDAFAGDRITVARDDDAGERRIPQALEGARHLRSPFAGADHHRAAFRLFRQVGGQHLFRIGGGDRGVKERFEKGARIGDIRHGVPPSLRNAGLMNTKPLIRKPALPL
jgi:hypothetical protein